MEGKNIYIFIWRIILDINNYHYSIIRLIKKEKIVRSLIKKKWWIKKRFGSVKGDGIIKNFKK